MRSQAAADRSGLELGGMATPTADEIAHVLALEAELQTDACRRNRPRLAELLADDFAEVGASGRIWTRQATLDHLTDTDPDGDQGEPAIEVHELTGRAVGDQLVLVQWVSERGRARARRTSLWRRDPGGWRLVHHQGTPVPGT